MRGHIQATIAAVALLEQDGSRPYTRTSLLRRSSRNFAEKASENQAEYAVESHVEEVNICRVREQGSNAEEGTEFEGRGRETTGVVPPAAQRLHPNSSPARSWM